MHCLREPATALMSLLSVALSSVTGKHMHDSILGGIFTPLKFKIVLDMGYTSLKYFCEKVPSSELGFSRNLLLPHYAVLP